MEVKEAVEEWYPGLEAVGQPKDALRNNRRILVSIARRELDIEGKKMNVM